MARRPRPRPPRPNDAQRASGKGPGGGGGLSNNPLMRPRPWWISLLVVHVVNYFLVQVFLPERPQQRIDVPYAFFKAQVVADNVSEVTSRGDVIQGTFKNAAAYPPDQANAPEAGLFQTVQPQFADTGLETLLEQHGVTINPHSLDEARPWWQTLLLSFGQTLLLIGLFFWISSRAAHQPQAAPVRPFGPACFRFARDPRGMLDPLPSVELAWRCFVRCWQTEQVIRHRQVGGWLRRMTSCRPILPRASRRRTAATATRSKSSATLSGSTSAFT